MNTVRESLFNQTTTPRAGLAGITWINQYHTTSSTLSLLHRMDTSHKPKKIALLLALCSALVLFSSLSWAWEGQVIRVVDGDTIVVLHQGEKVKVRLYGIDTPEKKQWYGLNAKQFVSSQVSMAIYFDPFSANKIDPP